MKPNLSATASGSSTGSYLVELEGQVRHADRDPVAGAQTGVAHPAAVDLHAVRRAEVHHGPAVLAPSQLGVAAGDVWVADDHVALAATADDDAAAAQDVAPAVADQQRLTTIERHLERARLAVG